MIQVIDVTWVEILIISILIGYTVPALSKRGVVVCLLIILIKNSVTELILGFLLDRTLHLLGRMVVLTFMRSINFFFFGEVTEFEGSQPFNFDAAHFNQFFSRLSFRESDESVQRFSKAIFTDIDVVNIPKSTKDELNELRISIRRDISNMHFLEPLLFVLLLSLVFREVVADFQLVTFESEVLFEEEIEVGSRFSHYHCVVMGILAFSLSFFYY